jgi:hypothetical protein
MRRFSFRVLTLASFVVLSALPAIAQTPQDLVAKNLAARGGAAKLAAISTIRFVGKVVYPGDFELAYDETRRRAGGAALIETSIQGLTVVQGYDGKMGWRVNPFEGRRDAERMSAEDARAMADDATIDGPLLTARARGAAISYLGREDFEGTEAYKLRVVEPGAVEYLVYLDPDTYLEIKVVETREIRGAKQVSLIELGDYEQVDGVYFPFAIESGAIDSASSDRSKLTIDHAVPNVAASDALFAMPVVKGSK